MPDMPLTGLIHAAAPNYQDEEEVVRFHSFNLDVHEYVTAYRLRRIVIVGSWWQSAIGNCKDLLYTQLKDHQRRMFSGVHVVPYSIYGEEARQGRGFIPQLIKALKERTTLTGLSNEPRDFIHVTDVARACVIGLDAPKGVYMAGWGKTSSPKQIAAEYGLQAPEWAEYPSAQPTYLTKPVPAWKPIIKLHDHIKESTR
jgi:hypothetical protein